MYYVNIFLHNVCSVVLPTNSTFTVKINFTSLLTLPSITFNVMISSTGIVSSMVLSSISNNSNSAAESKRSSESGPCYRVIVVTPAVSGLLGVNPSDF